MNSIDWKFIADFDLTTLSTDKHALNSFLPTLLSLNLHSLFPSLSPTSFKLLQLLQLSLSQFHKQHNSTLSVKVLQSSLKQLKKENKMLKKQVNMFYIKTKVLAKQDVSIQGQRNGQKGWADEFYFCKEEESFKKEKKRNSRWGSLESEDEGQKENVRGTNVNARESNVNVNAIMEELEEIKRKLDAERKEQRVLHSIGTQWEGDGSKEKSTMTEEKQVLAKQTSIVGIPSISSSLSSLPLDTVDILGLVKENTRITTDAPFLLSEVAESDWNSEREKVENELQQLAFYDNCGDVKVKEFLFGLVERIVEKEKLHLPLSKLASVVESVAKKSSLSSLGGVAEKEELKSLLPSAEKHLENIQPIFPNQPNHRGFGHFVSRSRPDLGKVEETIQEDAEEEVVSIIEKEQAVRIKNVVPVKASSQMFEPRVTVPKEAIMEIKANSSNFVSGESVKSMDAVDAVELLPSKQQLASNTQIYFKQDRSNESEQSSMVASSISLSSEDIKPRVVDNVDSVSFVAGNSLIQHLSYSSSELSIHSISSLEASIVNLMQENDAMGSVLESDPSIKATVEDTMDMELDELLREL